jgi:hypothetical protein
VDGVSLLHLGLRSLRYDGVMGKNSPALFELIRDPGVNQKSIPSVQQTRPGQPRAEADIPVMRVEPKPRVTLSLSREEEQPAAKPSPLPPSPPTAAAIKIHRLPQLRLTPTTVSVAVGAGLLVVLIIWATAYKMGEARAERLARRDLARLPGVTDPLRGDKIPLNTGLITPDPKSGQASGSKPAAQPPQPPVNPAPQVRPPATVPQAPQAGASPADTRQVGLNYCVAASRLSAEQAERAAGFLRENGVRAIAVLEAGAAGSNNPGSWKVVALQGVTAQEYRERAEVRTRVEADLTRLGEIYRRDPKGRVDFGQFAWEKKKE